MASTTFVDGVTTVLASWSNDVNSITYTTVPLLLQWSQTGAQVYAPDTGTGNTFVATYTPAITALTDGMVLRFKATHANTGAATLQVGSPAAAPILGGANLPLGGGEIVNGSMCQVQWSSTLNAFVLLAASGGAVQLPASSTLDQAPTTRQVLSYSRDFKNYVVDGRFDFWYEGTTQSTSGYGADTMWKNTHLGSTKLVSRQPLNPGNIPVPSAKYFSRTVVTSVAGAGNHVEKTAIIESVRALAGQQVTLSFYAASDAIRSLAIEFRQYFGTGGTPASDVLGIGAQKIALTTGWQRYVVTVTMPSVTVAGIGTNGDDYTQLWFWFDAGSNFNARTANLGQQSGIFDIACVQIEAGSTATNFEELWPAVAVSNVSRYFQQTTANIHATSTTASSIWSNTAYYPQMRVSPTLTVTAPGTQSSNISNVTATGVTPYGFRIDVDTNATGDTFVVNRSYNLDARQ